MPRRGEGDDALLVGVLRDNDIAHYMSLHVVM